VNLQLENKTALVTGSSQGIRFAIDRERCRFIGG
jgi:NAD(P)-dependent dehydrogenase (short-subunit alcohol dehydrogenase family)